MRQRSQQNPTKHRKTAENKRFPHRGKDAGHARERALLPATLAIADDWPNGGQLPRPHHAPSATSSRDRHSDAPPHRPLAATTRATHKSGHAHIRTQASSQYSTQKKERHPTPTRKRGGAALSGETPSLTVTTRAETPPRAHAHHPSTRRHPSAIAQQRGS